MIITLFSDTMAQGLDIEATMSINPGVIITIFSDTMEQVKDMTVIR